MDDSWSLYPSATWLDGVEDDEQLITRAFIKKTGFDGFYIVSSLQGVPDGKLIAAAEKVGIYTKYLC